MMADLLYLYCMLNTEYLSVVTFQDLRLKHVK